MGGPLEDDLERGGNNNDDDSNEMHDSSRAPLLSGNTTGTPIIMSRDATTIPMSNLANNKTLNVELYRACDSGNYEDVRKLLQKGAKSVTRNATENESPVYITCRKGFYNILGLLLDNLEANDELILGLKFFDKYGNSLFHILMKSISKGKGKNILDYKKCMEYTMRYINHEKYDGVKFINEEDHSLLVDACEEGLNEFVDRLLKDGADPTKYYKTREKKFAIHIAGSKGYIEIFNGLINKLKDINKLEYGLQQKDKFGNSILHAIAKGLEKTMKSARKNMEEKNDDEITNYVNCMKFLLLEYKDYVEIDAINDRGNTALHSAVLLQKFHHESRLVEILCDHGANSDIKNIDGKCAIVSKCSQISKMEESKPKMKGIRIQTDSLKKGSTDISYAYSRAEDLYNACESGSLDQVNVYVEIADCTMIFKEKEEKTAIRVAFSKGYFKIIHLLIKYMKNKKLGLDQVMAIIKKLLHNIKKKKGTRTEDEAVDDDIDYNECLNILIDNNQLFTDVLYAASEQGDVDIVSKLLSKGVDPTLPCEQNMDSCPILVSFKKGYHYVSDVLLKKTKEIGKLQEVLRENTINCIISNVIESGFLKKKYHMKKTTKKDEKKGTQNKVEIVDYGETFGVLLRYLNFELKNKNEILYDVCEKGLPYFVQKLMDFKVDPARKCKDKTENYPLIIAARKGYSDILEIILSQLEKNKLKHCLEQRSDLYGHSVLHVLLRRDKENSGTEDDYMRCMEMILKNRQYLDIDDKDNNGNTALHYAIRLRGDWTFAKVLIKNGARINVKNREGIHAMDRIPANTIEDILNECIKEPNFPNDRESENYAMKMDFNIFSHNESLVTRSEADLITALYQSKSYKHLMYHPLITAFIHIKWQKVRYNWYLDILLNIIFFSLLFFYIFYYGSDLIVNGVIDKNMQMNILPLKIVITVIGSLLMIREIVQCIILRWDYLKSFDNYLEVAILVLTCVMLYSENINAQHSIAAWLVVLSTTEIILLFEKMHLLQMAIYISMFKKVTYNFVKLTILLSWIVVAFGVSFYLLFHITSNNNEFATWPEAILKTLVMSTGEIDYSGLDFNHFPLASRLLFVVFIFSIFLVSMNLLNGIAISDIQVIQNDASKYVVRDQVELLLKFDQLRPVYNLFGCLNIWKKSQIFECCFPDKVIESIHPNRHYSILYVRCKGHNDYHRFRFCFLRVRRWFKSLLKNIRDCQCSCCNERNERVQNKCKGCKQGKPLLRCNVCGEEKPVCQDCQAKIQQGGHKCIFKHKYVIPPNFVTHAKEINKEIETKEEKNDKKITEEHHDKKLNYINIKVTHIERQQRNSEKRLKEIENNIQNLNERSLTNSEITARLTNIENCLENIQKYISKS